MKTDVIRRHLHAIIDARLGPVDYRALYPANVVAQNADGTLEIQPVDQRLPGLSKVPIRLGLPGCAVKVQAGSTVLLGFEAGDPRLPVVTLWGSSTITELAIGASPTKHLALAEDVKAALDAIVASFNGHTHAVAGAATKTPDAPIAGLNTNVASATVRST
jgi:hypothetical protein